MTSIISFVKACQINVLREAKLSPANIQEKPLSRVNGFVPDRENITIMFRGQMSRVFSRAHLIVYRIN